MNDHESPAQVREEIRGGGLRGSTAGRAMAYQQANLAVLPAALAHDFLEFCRRNPGPCPLLEVTEPGAPLTRQVADGADLRTDLPRYRVFVDGGLVEEPYDVRRWWRADAVGFLLGCSLGFERALLAAGVPLRHLDAGVGVPMYRTSVPCEPAGPFGGHLVVSMRPMPEALVETARKVTAARPWCHGAPCHIGDPAEIGVHALERPDFGPPPVLEPGDVPVFWCCGVTSQLVARAAKLEYLITHYPGHMLVTDLPVEEAPPSQKLTNGIVA